MNTTITEQDIKTLKLLQEIWWDIAFAKTMEEVSEKCPDHLHHLDQDLTDLISKLDTIYKGNDIN